MHKSIVSRDFISGSCDAPIEVPRVVEHDYSRVLSVGQTLRDRKRLRDVQRPVGEGEHIKRMLRTEYVGGWVLGYIAGFFSCAVVAGLTAPWWAPVVVWMVRS